MINNNGHSFLNKKKNVNYNGNDKGEFFMKKRFLGLFCGLATVTVAISLAIAAIGKTNNTFSVNRDDRPSLLKQR